MNKKKGFTLAELLIVVAIIAVLVGVAIPVFTSQLEKSRDAVTVSNLRSAYAMSQTAYLTQEGDTANAVTYTAGTGGAATVVVGNVVAKGTVAGTGTDKGFSGNDKELPFPAPANMGGAPGKYNVTFTYLNSGKLDKVEAAVAP